MLITKMIKNHQSDYTGREYLVGEYGVEKLAGVEYAKYIIRLNVEGGLEFKKEGLYISDDFIDRRWNFVVRQRLQSNGLRGAKSDPKWKDCNMDNTSIVFLLGGMWVSFKIESVFKKYNDDEIIEYKDWIIKRLVE